MAPFFDNKRISSLFWSGIEKFSVQGIGFIISITISRLVTPDDYGLIAMLSIFIAVSQIIIDCGLSNYLIQKLDRDSTDYSTIFYLNIFVGLACYLILFCVSPLIATFYKQPLLTKILRIYALILIIGSLTQVQRAYIYINNQYRKLSYISVTSILLSGLFAILVAYKGGGVWALVVYYLLQATISSSIIWIASDWHPQLKFSKQSAYKAFNFGYKLLLANIINTISSNLYTLVIGKKFNAINLGYYSRGQSISYVYPSNISNMFNQAAFPILCECQNDNKLLSDTIIKYLRASAVITFFPMAFLIMTAEPIIALLLGEKWLPSVFFVQILAFGYMFDPIMRLNAIILNVKGQTKYSLQAEIIKKITLIGILFITMPFGIKYIAVGLALYSLCDIIIVSIFVKKVSGVSLMDEIIEIGPILVSTILLSLILVGIRIIIQLRFWVILLSGATMILFMLFQAKRLKNA